MYTDMPWQADNDADTMCTGHCPGQLDAQRDWLEMKPAAAIKLKRMTMSCMRALHKVGVRSDQLQVRRTGDCRDGTPMGRCQSPGPRVAGQLDVDSSVEVSLPVKQRHMVAEVTNMWNMSTPRAILHGLAVDLLRCDGCVRPEPCRNGACFGLVCTNAKQEG